MVHQPVSRGFAVFADAWLSVWLAEISADLWENGSALEVVLHDYALYKSTFTLPYLPSGFGTCVEQPAVVCQECTVADDVPSPAEDCTFPVVV